MTKSAKIRELQHLAQLHDTSIERQQALLTKIAKGKFKSTQVSDQILYALAKGELELLKRRREEIDTQINELEVVEESAADVGEQSSVSDLDESKI